MVSRANNVFVIWFATITFEEMQENMLNLSELKPQIQEVLDIKQYKNKEYALRHIIIK